MQTIENKIETSNEIPKKIAIVVILTTILSIPLAQIGCQVEGRKGYEDVAKVAIAKSWGGDFNVSSPIVEYPAGKLFPVNAETDVVVDTKEKKRGVFKIPVYAGTWKQKVIFAKDKINELQNAPAPKTEAANSVEKDKAPVIRRNFLLPISPTSSVQSFKVTDASGKKIDAILDANGIRVWLDNDRNQTMFDASLSIEVAFRGTGDLRYNSLATRDEVVFRGNWIKPQYLEENLPLESTLTAKGFEGHWSLHGRSIDGIYGESAGVSMMVVSSDYIKVDRAIKYGILLIVLTFLVLFAIEVLGGIHIHPLQYTLIGLSLCIFYLLLLAVSEVTGFDLAYFMSTVAVVSLISFYFVGFVKEKKYLGWIAGEQVILSGFFYLLLSLEERAFLVGTIGLFIVLATLMMATRQFDWYRGSLKKS